MLRTKAVKKILAVVLCIAFVLGCSAVNAADFRPDNEELYFGALEEQAVESQRTVSVRRGDFIVNTSCKGEIEYENISYVFNTITMGNVTFKEFSVSSGDYVHKGDPICRISISADVSEMGELAEKIEVAQENLEAFCELNEELLSDYTYASKNGKTEEERELGRLLYDRLKVNYNEERTSREKEIDEMQTRLDTLTEISETRYITAPADGVVSNLAWLRRGETLKSYAYLAAIFDTGNVRIRVNGGFDALNYNASVTVIQAQGSRNIEIPGRVISCKSATLSPNLISSYDLVELLDDPSELSVNKEVTVRVEATHMENALIVAREAVKLDTKGTYVFLLQDGVSVKRYIVIGGTNTSDSWIIKGLEEGDVLVIK